MIAVDFDGRCWVSLRRAQNTLYRLRHSYDRFAGVYHLVPLGVVTWLAQGEALTVVSDVMYYGGGSNTSAAPNNRCDVVTSASGRAKTNTRADRNEGSSVFLASGNPDQELIPPVLAGHKIAGLGQRLEHVPAVFVDEFARKYTGKKEEQVVIPPFLAAVRSRTD